jgi:hypothetical protein
MVDGESYSKWRDPAHKARDVGVLWRGTQGFCGVGRRGFVAWDAGVLWRGTQGFCGAGRRGLGLTNRRNSHINVHISLVVHLFQVEAKELVEVVEVAIEVR